MYDLKYIYLARQDLKRTLSERPTVSMVQKKRKSAHPESMDTQDEGTDQVQNPKKRILIVDDHPIFRLGLAGLISEQPHLEVCGHAESAPLALEAMRNLKPDLVLLDLSLRGTNGIELIKLMKAEQPRLPILVVSMYDEAIFGLRALKAGALGYVMKAEAMAQVAEAITKVLRGKIYVSPNFSDKLIFKAIQSIEAGTGAPVDVLSD